MNSDECREIARKYFAIGIKSESDVERELAMVQGEAWMTRWRYWSETMSSMPAPQFAALLPSQIIPYRF